MATAAAMNVTEPSCTGIGGGALPNCLYLLIEKITSVYSTMQRQRKWAESMVPEELLKP